MLERFKVSLSLHEGCGINRTQDKVLVTVHFSATTPDEVNKFADLQSNPNKGDIVRLISGLESKQQSIPAPSTAVRTGVR